MSQLLHTHAAILSTGDELVMGQLSDTNARWLAEQLTAAGVRVHQMSIIGDDLAMLSDEIERLSGQAPLLLMSGGLGPTEGDLTRRAVCRATRDVLCRDPQAQRELEGKMAARGRPVTERQLRQSDRPSRARCLSNSFGTAPGLHVSTGTCDIVCLPGPPGELRPMWLANAVGILRRDPGRAVVSRLVYAVGLPEADAAERLKDLTARGQSITINLTASGGVLTVRARAEGLQTQQLRDAFDLAIDQVLQRLHPHVFACEAATDASALALFARAIIDECVARGQRLTTVESCTGGMLGQQLTAVPGASRAYAGGLVTYDDALKSSLAHVSAQTIGIHGAVSHEVASAMAAGGLAAVPQAHWVLAVTGIAGPGGETASKPVGTVWIALASASGERQCRRFCFPGDREDVRTRAASAAMTMLHFALKGIDPGRLLWQV